MDEKTKCACPSCHCTVKPDAGVVQNGKLYCSATCARECTQTTCLCIHDQCDDHAGHCH